MKTRREAGELLFEKYLVEQGYGLPEHEPDLGVSKRPDYVIKRDDYRCVCEVKEFARDASSLPRTPGYSSTGMDFVLKPIRSQIRQAAPQLKPLAASDMALVVVIANPHRATVFTGDREAVCAMYGDLAVTLTINPAIGAAEGDPVWIADRNGKLTNDHPYISAVVFVREPGHGATGHRVDVFKTASATATALPTVFFDGPADRVFEFDAASGVIRQVRGPT